MKNKKMLTSIMIVLILFFQVTTVKAASFSDSYINKTYTPQMNLIVSNVLSDDAKKVINQYSIYLVDVPIQNIVSNTRFSNSVGNMNADKKEIVVNNYWDSIRCTFHEIGHAIDYDQNTGHTGKYSQTSEYQQIASEETNKIVQYSNEDTQAFKSIITEQFAETFAIFVMRPNDLKMVAPKTYDYFEKLNLVKEDFKTYSIRTNTPQVLDPTKIPVAIDY